MTTAGDEKSLSILDVLPELGLEASALGATASFYRLHPSTQGATEEQIAAREETLGCAYPPTFRRLLSQSGSFALGEPKWLTIWPLEEHVTALARAADELECAATAEDVADNLGLDPEIVAALQEIILVGSDGHTDFVGFDRRTRNVTTNECAFTLQLMDDLEIEHLAQRPTPPCEGAGFARWLEKHVAFRAR